MTRKVLLYGATGFSGQLIARHAQQRWQHGDVELLLGGRDAAALARLGEELGLRTRAFALDDAARIEAALGEPGLELVINAAGPFAWTALPLARAALRTGRHYVDINGEADVYKRLDDLGFIAEQRGVVILSGAGHSATVSDLLLEHALQRLQARGVQEIGTVRIAFSQLKQVSRGSAMTAWRSVREQVVVMRQAPPRADGSGPRGLQLAHLPAGQVERSFDFDAHAPGRADHGDTRRIATAVSLLDLFTARLTVQRRAGLRTKRIEAYIETPGSARALVQAGAWSAPFLALPPLRRLLQAQLALLPEGPDAADRAEERHTVLLEIDDGCGRTLVDWCLQTPEPYGFTAPCAIGVADGLLQRGLAPGWRTPAEAFDVAALFGRPPAPGSLLEHCRFVERVTAA